MIIIQIKPTQCDVGKHHNRLEIAFKEENLMWFRLPQYFNQIYLSLKLNKKSFYSGLCINEKKKN